MASAVRTDVVVVGGGLAGIVTALECLKAGRHVTLVDRDTPERLGGLALWAFGGMALVDTPLQRRMKIADSPERALRDWLSFGELPGGDTWPRRWAEFYVQHSREQVYDWLLSHGLKFFPVVNWVERGRFGEGNSVPRYHVLWGTSRELTHRMILAMQAADVGGRLKVLSGHRVTAIERSGGVMDGVQAVHEASGAQVRVQAPVVVLAMGGVNGSIEQCVANWPAQRPRPATMLNGAHPFADGALHRLASDELGACLTHAGEMWNYAAGFAHPQPHFPGHGLSTIPCKSALWLDHAGRRIGPEPLVTGFDTHELCQRVAAQDKPWTWHLLNWRIAAKEFAISGAQHNQRLRDKQLISFLMETILGNHRLIRQMQRESRHFLVDETLAGLARKMNELTQIDQGEQLINPQVLQSTVDAFDANFAKGLDLSNDDQIRRILHARQWRPDRVRTCKPAPLQQPGSGPFIAIQMQLITRKSLGGLQTDLQSRVLQADGQVVSGLYCVGEAAGFGGGGASGKRSLEGTFLPGCILTARAAARSISVGA
jgi:predicted oxidoreductase